MTMAITIREIHTNKKHYLDLLLLGDEHEAMIDRYLEVGRMFVLEDPEPKSVAVVVALDAQSCELKNLATYPAAHCQGYGRRLVRYVLAEFLASYQTMYVGTGEVPKTLRFYEGCGFRRSHRLKNFFTDHYPQAIVEDGVLLQDMIYLRADRADVFPAR